MTPIKMNSFITLKNWASSLSPPIPKPPCAGCKLLRRRCNNNCILLPYFPSTDPEKFACVHRVFGASNVCKMLQDIEEEQREDAVRSLVYEANARLKDPIYGSVRFISYFQDQVFQVQSDLAMSLAENVQLRSQLSEALWALTCIRNEAISNTLSDTSLQSALGHTPISSYNQCSYSFGDY